MTNSGILGTLDGLEVLGKKRAGNIEASQDVMFSRHEYF
jgi:hypothetical protein